MRFSKVALTVDEQTDLLVRRGMRGDPERIRRRLASVNYYRLAAYWHIFWRPESEAFGPEAHIDAVWDHYLLDRRLRLLTMDALERFEVAVRTRLANALALGAGPFGYTEAGVIFAKDKARRDDFLRHFEEELKRSREPFLSHFRQRYGDEHRFPPVWVAVEVLSFGSVVSLFQGAPQRVQDDVAAFFGVPAVVLESWLKSLNVVRNICAHHGRLWNRELSVKPKIPRAQAWKQPVEVGSSRIFGVLSILADVMYRIAPGSRWTLRVRALLEERGATDLEKMGFPPNWTECAVWHRAWSEVSARSSGADHRAHPVAEMGELPAV